MNFRKGKPSLGFRVPEIACALNHAFPKSAATAKAMLDDFSR